MSSIERTPAAPDPAAGPRRSIRWTPPGGALLLALGALLLGHAVVRSFDPNAFNWDVAWILYVAGEMLDGATLYVDYIDENPPLIFWLSVPPVAVARALGLPAILAWNLFVAAWILLAAGLADRILRRARPEAGGHPATTHAGIIAALFACVAVLASGIDYGQREHLFFVATFPYLCAAAARAAGRPLAPGAAFGVGLFAGLGIAIKPFFLALWLAVELFVRTTGRDRWRAPESYGIALVQALFAGALLAFAGAYVDLIALSLQVTAGYREGYGASIRFVSLAIAGAGIAAHALRRGAGPDLALRRVLVAASVGAAVSAIAQGAGFTYRYLPVESLGGVLLGVVALGWLEARRPGSDLAMRIPRLALLALVLWASLGLVRQSVATYAPGERSRTSVALLSRFVERHAPGGTVWAMSTSVNPAFPVVNLTGARWSSRHCCVTLLGSLYPPEVRQRTPFPYHPMSALPPAEQRLFDEVAEDLAARPPDVIIVDAGSEKQTLGPTSFRFLEYFQRDRRLAPILRRYELAAQIGPFRVLRRRPG